MVTWGDIGRERTLFGQVIHVPIFSGNLRIKDKKDFPNFFKGVKAGGKRVGLAHGYIKFLLFKRSYSIFFGGPLVFKGVA